MVCGCSAVVKLVVSALASKYLQPSGRLAAAVFGFLGVTELEFVRADGLAISDEHKAAALKSAQAPIGSITAQMAKAA